MIIPQSATCIASHISIPELSSFCENIAKIAFDALRNFTSRRAKLVQTSAATDEGKPAGGFFTRLLTFGAQAYGKYRLRSGTGFALDVGDYFPLS